jgi:hypothetical protein
MVVSRRSPLGGLRVCGEVVHHLQPLAQEDAAELIERLSESAASAGAVTTATTKRAAAHHAHQSAQPAAQGPGALAAGAGSDAEDAPSTPLPPPAAAEAAHETGSYDRRTLALARAAGGIPARLLEAVNFQATIQQEERQRQRVEEEEQAGVPALRAL